MEDDLILLDRKAFGSISLEIANSVEQLDEFMDSSADFVLHENE